MKLEENQLSFKPFSIVYVVVCMCVCVRVCMCVFCFKVEFDNLFNPV